MAMFGRYKADAKQHPLGLGGAQWTFEFPNGYGASIIQGMPHCVSSLFELAVTHGNRLCYGTPVTSDTRRGNAAEMGAMLDRISRLPVNDGCTHSRPDNEEDSDA